MDGPLEQVRQALSDRYAIGREIGRGGTAVVFQAEDLKHRRQVAIKVLRPAVAAELGAQRFIREIETIARLNHPHILPLFDSGEVDGLPYFVMPLVTGESLRDRIAREQQLPVDDALEVLRDVAEALAYAHSHGIVHRDITPGNILFSGGHAMVSDFGVARAISAAISGDGEPQGDAAGHSLSGSAEQLAISAVIGTPLYMSPEQLSGSARLDGRSDLYSLGCVLYEMLVGVPPFAGRSVEEVRAQHLMVDPSPVSSLGRRVTPEIDELVRRLLAKMPADRFATAQQLVEAIPASGRPSGAVSLLQHIEKPARRWRRMQGLAAVSAVLALTWGILRSQPTLKPDRYAVLSTATAMGGQDSRYVEAVRAEIARWEGTEVVSQHEVLDAVQRHGAPESESDLLTLARASRAGRLVRVEQVVRGDSIEFDVSMRGTPRGSADVTHILARCPIQGDACERALKSAARQLLLGDASTDRSVLPSTTSLAAYRSFMAGTAAFRDWRLAEADSLFQQAVGTDARFAEAWLQLASTRWWRGESPEQWRGALQRALAVDSSLTPRDRVRGTGLLALADRRWVDACAAFDALLRADSLDYSSWYGRAQCLTGNHEVVVDPASPTGLRFTTSYEAALTSYHRALVLAPGAHRAFGEHLFAAAAGYFYVQEHHIRQGSPVGSDSLVYYAFPGLDADTLTFFPRRFAEMRTIGVQLPPSHVRAVLRNRSLLSGLTLDWVRAYPQSAEAHIARSAALEMLSEGGQASTARDEAMAEAVLARQLASTHALRVDAAVAEVRLRVKAADYAGARRLADSLTTHTLTPDSATGRRLAAVAALIGRIERSVALAEAGAADLVQYGPGGRRMVFPPALAEPAFALLVYSSFCAPVDSIRALKRRVEERVSAYMLPEEVDAARQEATEFSAVLSFECIGVQGAHHYPEFRHSFLRIQLLIAEGDTAEARTRLSRYGVMPNTRATTKSMEAALMASRMWLDLGDTLHAIQELDVGLAATAGYGQDLLGPEMEGNIPMAAALVQMMVLRADLAARDGDAETARRWAAAVVTLWEDADPVLQPTVMRMRALSRISSTSPR